MGRRVIGFSAAIVVGALALAGVGVAEAHQRSLSYSNWRRLGDSIEVSVRLTALDASRLPFYQGSGAESAGELARYLASAVRVTSRSAPCQSSEPAIALPERNGWHAFRWVLRCKNPASVDVHFDLFFDDTPSHLHFARFLPSNAEAAAVAAGSLGRDATSTDAGIVERLITFEARDWSLPTGDTRAEAFGTSFGSYLVLGIRHIMSGYDHLAFVLALILIAGSFVEIVELVTAFTVAHSLTLAAAVVGGIHPESAAVEAVIGFSIALVAAENSWLLSGRDRRVPWAVAAVTSLLLCSSWLGYGRVTPLTLAGLGLFSVCHFALMSRTPRPAALRAAVAFCFGLVHGFGFAGVLSEVGLPPGRLFSALFGFNLGVEAGQLASMAVVWPLLVWANRRGARATLADYGSAAICGLGTFWFLLRAFG